MIMRHAESAVKYTVEIVFPLLLSVLILFDVTSKNR